MTANHSIESIQKEVVEEFAFFDDWEEKYAYLIDLGKNLLPLSEEHKTEQNKIKGCQSQVWLNSYLLEDKVIFEADSDAMIVKGLVSLLVRVLSVHTPDEILAANLDFLDEIGMKQHLSPTRSNGLAAMIKQMRMHALAYKARLTEKK